ncbi:hypothetical protein CVT26_010450 [Gymnopilus dilepis]|uniref:F-box domain-containing protein n=1 Tax=Gymnopilus dilepis TaxID=231916 RepID=A0A409Y0Q0_9AGAR|nr:hypothetical protein CVT26_010450 [Gymnopilus dilepis]
MATLPMSKSWADLDEPGRYKLYRPCEKGTENCEACLELKQVEDQMMSGTTDAMEGLIEHHRKVRTRLNQAHDPLVHKVPVEITSYIFQLSMPPIPADNNLRNMKSVELQAPTILSAVCTAWRQLTLSTPQLWTFSKVRLSPSDRDGQSNRKFEDHCSFFHERLRRSGQLPLKICVLAWDSASYNPLAIGVVQAIALCCSRWQILDLDFRFCWNLSHLLLGKTYQAPNLQALRLNILHSRTEPPVSIVARPKDVYLVGSLDQINLNWSEVTSVHLFKSYSSDCTKVLQLAPLLECCRFSQWPRSRDNSSVLNTPITHTRIREVILEKLQGSRDTAPFLEEANFPALRSITFPGFPGLTRTVVGLIKRSCCSLQELVFTDGMYQQLAYVLQEVPSLQRLICRTTLSSDRVNELIQLLSSRKDSGSNAAFFSQLGHIELTVMQADEIQWPLLAEMIRPLSEGAVRPPLHTVQIDIEYDIWADHPPQQDIDSYTLRRLQDALNDGFNLRLNVVRGGTSEKYDVFQAILDASWKDITRQWYHRPVLGLRPLGSDEEY